MRSIRRPAHFFTLRRPLPCYNIPMESPIRIGISACLLGERVRYDGGHKRDPLLAETLGRFVTFVPVCPETECGLGVPREIMRLAGDPASPRLVTIHTRMDLTAPMEEWAARRVEELAGEGLAGFIVKSRSPSCALHDAPIIAAAAGPGLFTRALMHRLPLLPVEDESRLHDPALREKFLARLPRHRPAP